MRNYIFVSLFALLTGCAQPPPDRQSDDKAGIDTTAGEITLLPDEEKDPILPPLDSSAYHWEDGYLVLEWATLAGVEFKWGYSEEVGQDVPFPLFGTELQALNGRPVQISGYAIPLEETEEQTFIVLSAFPYSQCFFCGQAGPESVVDVLTGTKLPRLSVDEKTTFRGRLRLNDDDLRYLNYILDEAELVEDAGLVIQ